MSGPLVIAELRAFRAILLKAGRGEGKGVAAWSRSVIANAIHRLGAASVADDASARAHALADCLQEPHVTSWQMEEARERAVQALDALIAAVQRLKARNTANASEAKA